MVRFNFIHICNTIWEFCKVLTYNVQFVLQSYGLSETNCW